jgi:dihydrodipicolinate synthase/N-acetylneuraminate lyase
VSVPSLAEAFGRLRGGPGRRVHGISATLLPYTPAGGVDWEGFERHVARTHAAGLDVAVNMDTGFGDLLAPEEREAVLARTRAVLGSGVPCYAGAYAGPGRDPLPGYRRSLRAIEAHGALPVLVQCRAMHGLPPAELAALYARILEGVEGALAFELGPVFAPHGALWEEEAFARILELPGLLGAKHSSLDRGLELSRLALRDARRPDFRIYTGNDLAIDMVAYGSDYLLGLSTFAPEAFAARDRALATGDLAYLALTDALQHLGNVAFRAPVPAYKHAAALYLHLTGGLATPEVHPGAPRRPAADVELLHDCARRLREVGVAPPGSP